MKVQLPLTPRYLLPVLVMALAVDALVAAGVAVTLFRAEQDARTFVVEGLQCTTYAPTMLGSIYLVARCTKEDR